MSANIKSSWENGALVWRDGNNHIVDVHAPVRAILDIASVGGFVISDGSADAGYSKSGGLAHCQVLTGDAADDDIDIASYPIFDASKGMTIEGKIANGDADKSAFNFGFSDAITEAADKIAFTFATTSLTTNATDAALIFSDVDATADTYRFSSVSNDTDGAVTASTTAPADDTYITFRIDVTPAGVATAYMDGVAFSSTRTIRTTIPYCAYVGYITRGESAQNAIKIKYLAAWQWGN